MSVVTGNETDAEKIARLSGKVHELEKALTASEANCNRIIAASQRGDKVDVLQLELKTEQLHGQVANLEGQLIDLTRKEKGYARECAEVEQTLGTVLEYPRYVDDQANFPGSTEADGCCTGEHTPSTIAMEAAQKIVALKAKVNELELNSIPQHAIDDLRTQLDEAREGQVSLFDMDYPPRASQGAPTHEVQDLLTADTANFWIRRIEELTHANNDLDMRLQESQTSLRRCTAASGISDETAAERIQSYNSNTQYRVARVSQLENLLRWTLQAIGNQGQRAIGEREINRARQIYGHVFPPQPENPYTIRTGRVSAGMDYNHRNEYEQHVQMEHELGRHNDMIEAVTQNFAAPARAWAVPAAHIAPAPTRSIVDRLRAGEFTAPPATPPPAPTRPRR